MIEVEDFIFQPPVFMSAHLERREPTHDLIFSCGSPIAPLQLWERRQRCLRLTVYTGLFRSPRPSTHYWFSRDMDWWFSVAKQVLDDVHLLLTRQSNDDRSFLSRVSLYGPWEFEVTWLSRFVHRYYEAEGTILHPLRHKIDEHLRDIPPTLRFDIFLLQCWSEMTLCVEQRRTFEAIHELNELVPEVSMQRVHAHVNALAADSGRGEQIQEPDPDDFWITNPAADLEFWAQLQPALAREHQALFVRYTRFRIAVAELDLWTGFWGNRECPPALRDAHFLDLLRRMTDHVTSYINYTIFLAQRDLGMVLHPNPSSGSDESSVAPPSLGRKTPSDL